MLTAAQRRLCNSQVLKAVIPLPAPFLSFKNW